VAQRDRELSVRIALGAPRRHVLGIVVGQALALAGTGIGLGLIGALALTRVLRSLLFAVSPADPATFAMVAGGLLLIAIAASWFPAHRAARADPLATMRGD
jgi:putative ABC transport system permease protein